ncbi:MAG TPA: VCBS repeat-containing protein [Pyrinomonadaceae bacterium]|jgi:hypothetical protein|nr:VCBS repeat-containing protein [Pyrinomonadaceae bacterium]
MKRIKKLAGKCLLNVLAMFLLVNLVSAAAVVRLASGGTPAAIQAAVDLFRIELGGPLNPNTTQTYPNGRREITWDDVPDNFALPTRFPGHYFNTISPRGIIMSTPANNHAGDNANMMVSRDADSGVVRFGDLDPSYTNTFRTFSGQRLASVGNSGGIDYPPVINFQFFIPGTGIPATVNGFGIVFADVDSGAHALVRVYGVDGRILTLLQPSLNANNGLSFVGISFNAGERIARVEVKCGRNQIISGNVDGEEDGEWEKDVIAVDDIIYGEPRAAQFHPGDFDGDGTSDSAIFRPANGTWYFLNSGTSTFSVSQWGMNGDVPVSGDFDGDARADMAIFRPSNGLWFISSSSNEATLGRQFGQNGDRPVVSDYDKDGRSDIAIWRPSDGSFYVSGSSGGFSNYYAYPFGVNGDIPVGTGVFP